MRVAHAPLRERDQYLPTLQAFLARRRLRPDSLVAEEVPLHGRSIDLVALTRTGSLSSVEFKLGKSARAIEQAIYNLPFVDYSYAVLGVQPSGSYVRAAEQYGVGVVVVRRDLVDVLLAPQRQSADPILRDRLKARFQPRAVQLGRYVCSL